PAIIFLKVGLSKVVEAIKMAIDVPDPLRQVLDSRQAVQQFVPASLASGFPCFCSCGFHGCTSLLGPLPHLSSFALQPVHSLLPPLSSHGQLNNKTEAEIDAAQALFSDQRTREAGTVHRSTY
uniref:Uncharacterized protein n=1 Tax=Monodon monoceros TaxID=40151 RepID=A0A8C6BU05_MONMO